MRLRSKIGGAVLAALLTLLAVVGYPRIPAGLDLDDIRLPPGFQIAIYAGDVAGARSLALGDNGSVFVGTRSGTVYAVRDSDGDFRVDEIFVLAVDLDMPNGVAFQDGALYVAEIHRIIRFDDIEERLADPPTPVVVRDDFPTGWFHGWRYIGFAPDRRLYMSVGVPCNVCQPDDERLGTIMRMNSDGSELEIFARGVRNSIGFAWHPETGELWFTDNGRDWMGNNEPPDELNHAPVPGLHFGFPHCHGASTPDPDFGEDRSCDEFTRPVQDLDPHVASLGMRFYAGGSFPAQYRGQIFIAEHGSWNRMPPIGYRITRVRLEGGTAVEYQVFADGWLRAGRASGRPVDVLFLPDGSMLASDDQAGVIYRISYED